MNIFKGKTAIWLSTVVLVMVLMQYGVNHYSHAANRSSYTPNTDNQQSVIQCANLIYGRNKSSICFADAFLVQLRKDSYVRANRRFRSVKLGSDELFQYPFSMMTGKGVFALTPTQRLNLRSYLEGGGFLVASAGCSSNSWDASFRSEMRKVFPNRKFKKLKMNHPIFKMVYSIDKLQSYRRSVSLEAIEIEGRIVMIYSPEGLNDVSNSGPGCCCCGGSEIRNAIKVNANLLAYALTH